jgi:hypothetical protein
MDQQCIRKVKLKLIQPQIMCGGRDKVESYYRGKIISELERFYVIQFKYKGELVKEQYEKDYGFSKLELQDIKIVE